MKKQILGLSSAVAIIGGITGYIFLAADKEESNKDIGSSPNSGKSSSILSIKGRDIASIDIKVKEGNIHPIMIPDLASMSSEASSIKGKSPFLGLLFQREIEQLFKAASAIGPDSEKSVQDLLEKLRKGGDKAAQSLYDGYKNMDESMYSERRLTVEILRQIGNANSLGAFTEIASSPIPEERMKDIHYFSSVKEETLIRMAAVGGIGEIAKANSGAAEKILFEMASTSNNVSIVRTSINGFLNAGSDPEARAQKLITVVDPKFHELIKTTKDEVEGIQNVAFNDQHIETVKQAQKEDVVLQGQGMTIESEGLSPETEVNN